MRRFKLVVPALVALSFVACTIGADRAGAQNHMSYSTTLSGTEMSYSKTDIDASPEAVFAVVNDFRSWAKWMWPRNGDVKQTFSGAASGKRAVYEWEGAGEAGSGRAQIVEASAPGKVVVDLDFKAPVAGHLTWVFAIERAGDKTKVAVSTSGSRQLVSKSFETILGPSPSLTRLGCVAGGEPYKGWCEVLMVKMPAIAKAARERRH